MPSRSKIARFARAVRTRLTALRNGGLSCLPRHRSSRSSRRSSTVMMIDRIHPTTNCNYHEESCDDVVTRRNEATYVVGPSATDASSTSIDYTTSTPMHMVGKPLSRTYDSSVNSHWLSTTTVYDDNATHASWEDTYLVFQNLICPPPGWMNQNFAKDVDNATNASSSSTSTDKTTKVSFDLSYAGRILPPPDGFDDDDVDITVTKFNVRRSTDSANSVGSQRSGETKHRTQLVKEAGDVKIRFEIVV